MDAESGRRPSELIVHALGRVPCDTTGSGCLTNGVHLISSSARAPVSGYSNSRITWSTARLSPGLARTARDPAVALGAQHVFHLHRLDNRERLAGLDLLSGRHVDRRQQAGHRRQQQARGVRCFLLGHQRQELGGAARQHLRAARHAAMRQPESGARQPFDLHRDRMLLDASPAARLGPVATRLWRDGFLLRSRRGSRRLPGGPRPDMACRRAGRCTLGTISSRCSGELAVDASLALADAAVRQGSGEQDHPVGLGKAGRRRQTRRGIHRR